MCSTDSGTNILMYTKQVLSKAALYIRPRKVQPSSKTVRAESPLPFSGKKKHLSFLRDDDTLSSRALWCSDQSENLLKSMLIIWQLFLSISTTQ